MTKTAGTATAVSARSRLKGLAGALALCLGLWTAGSAPAAAQAYPSDIVRLVVPYPAGGSVDALARLYADRLQAALGKPVVVENRAGAAGNIAFTYVAKAKPDGYTLLFVGTSIATNPWLYTTVEYDPIKDFSPVAMLAVVPNVLVVNPTLPFRTVAELVAYARANPGKLNFGSSGNGSTLHLAGELFKTQAQIDIVHVPYRGAAPALNDLLAGQIQMMFDTSPTSIPHIRSGALRVLATATETRMPELPDVPTFKESGYPQLISGGWVGILAPAGTPQPIVDRLNAELTRIMADADVQGRLKAMGATALGGTPDEVGRFIAAEVARWGAAVKASGARID